jgi:uncharacterized membrane-anchored protein YjiN (DUF445 family)
MHSSLMEADLTAKRKSLRRHRCFATGLLLLAVAVFVLARASQENSFPIRLAASAAEAAMVGGLADWFAITALFRRPLGLPIPHTALIPLKKGDIGRSLGDFVKDNFLEPKLLVERLRRENRALQFACWLKTPTAANFVAERIVAALPALLETVEDRRLQAFLRELGNEALQRINLKATVDAVLNNLVLSGKHMELLDALLDQVRPALHRNRDTITAKVGEVTGRWIPQFVDRKLAARLVDALEKTIDALGRADDPDRMHLDRWIREVLRDLQKGPTYATVIEDMKDTLSTQPVFIRSLETLWGEIKSEILADLGSPNPQVARKSAEIVQTTGRLLERSAVMQQYLNAAIERVLSDYIAPWRLGIASFIAEQVASWDGRQVAHIIELQVGKDLQYVRVNGTVVGALIGILLFLSNELLPRLLN